MLLDKIHHIPPAGGLHREAGGPAVRVRGSGGSVAGLVCPHPGTLPRADCQDIKQRHHLQVDKCRYNSYVAVCVGVE